MTDPLELSARSRVLILAVHPDDETLAAGGLILRSRALGAAVRVLFLTSGDNNPWPQRALDRRWRIGPRQRREWARRREREARAALQELGLAREDSDFLRYPDQGLTRLLLTQPAQWAAALACELRSWRPTLVVAPAAYDRHPDHNALAVAVDLLGSQPLADPGSWKLATYCIHRRTGKSREIPSAHPAICLALTGEEMRLKRQAMRRHESQLLLSRGRFMSYLRDVETFGSPGAPHERCEHHTIGLARQEGGEFLLRLDVSARRGAMRRLLLVRQGVDLGQSLEIELPPCCRRGAEARIRDGATGALVGQAFCRRQGRAVVVGIPARLLAGADRLHAKLEERTLFFDRCGWRALPVPRPEEAAIPLPMLDRASAPHPAPGRTCVIVPCYNVASTCVAVIREAARHADRVIAVDDGSRDATGPALARLEEELGGRLTVLRFPANRGKGVALLEALRHEVSAHPCDVIVSIDSDGQHRAADIPALAARCLAEQADLVIGSREDRRAMPPLSRIGNGAMTRLLRLVYPECPRDTQSGLRAHSARFAREIVAHVTGRRYETEMKILLLALHQRLKVRSMTIPTVYYDQNRASHFRPLRDSVSVLWSVVWSMFQ